MSKLLMIKPSCSNQQGFSLLEILVAFSIMAISLGVLLNIFSTGVRAAFVAEEYTIAVQMAETLLAQTGKETELSAASSQSRRDGKFQWQVEVTSVEPSIAGFDADQLDIQMYQVLVRVFWHDGDEKRTVKLQTLKLAARTE